MSFIHKQDEYEEQLAYLLRFISGEVEPHEVGFCTYRLDDEKQSKQLHRACMELERRNLIERWFECPKLIVWRPKAALILTDEEP
jgi:hypothetical protein